MEIGFTINHLLDFIPVLEIIFMPLRFNTRNFAARFERFTNGGYWSISLPALNRRNLTLFWADGLFSAASDTIPINYLTLYILVFGATSSQVGWLSALTSLAGAICLLPGAFIVERYGHRKSIVVWFGLMARVGLLILALVPLISSGQTLIWLIILISVVRAGAGNILFPAWVSMSGDLVPIEGRGRYFSARSIIVVVASIIMTYLVGEFITLVGSALGYQVSFALAFLVGLASTYFFARIIDIVPAHAAPSSAAFSWKEAWHDVRSNPVFLTFCIISAFWNFFLNIAGPFFNVYMVDNLSFTAAMVGITAVATSITKLLTQKKMGEISDRVGPEKVQMISMFLIPILPFAWVFATQLWHVVAINLFGGIVWGAFELTSFNFLLQLTPPALRARYSAFFQIIVTVSLAAGAALGSVLLGWGYTTVFLVSGFGRVFAAICFLFMIRWLGKNKSGPHARPQDGAQTSPHVSPAAPELQNPV